MKIQYKAALIIALFGILLVVVFSFGFEDMSGRMVINRELNNMQNISEEVAQHIGSHLKEKAGIALTLSSSPLIKDALLQSNSEFASLSPKELKRKIENLNQRWMETKDINDPFIQAYMTNLVAEHFIHHQEINGVQKTQTKDAILYCKYALISSQGGAKLRRLQKAQIHK